MVIAKKQTGGRGKPGSHWYSPEGGLYFSLILKPRKNPSSLVSLTLIFAEAISLAIEKTTGLKSEIKPPNDILISNKKACGILIEKSKDSLIIGIGLNVNIEKFESGLKATSLKLETGKSFGISEILEEILTNIQRKYLKFLGGEV